MLPETVRTVCAAAGWRVPPPDAGGRYAFSLEGGLEFTLSSSDGDRLLAHAVLLAPGEEREIRAELLAFVLSATTGRFSRLRSVPALDARTGELVLYGFAELKGRDEATLKIFVEAFLNDLAFWKAQPRLSTA